jgi:hypothetical protein
MTCEWIITGLIRECLTLGKKEEEELEDLNSKLRWEDSADHGIMILGKINWSNLALNREDWRILLKKSRAHAGLSSQ